MKTRHWFTLGEYATAQILFPAYRINEIFKAEAGKRYTANGHVGIVPDGHVFVVLESPDEKTFKSFIAALKWEFARETQNALAEHFQSKE